MEHTIRLAESGDYIEALVVGDLTRAGIARVTGDYYKLGSEIGVHCFLLDVTRSRNTEGPVDNARITTVDGRARVVSFEAMVAILVDPSDHSHDWPAALAQVRGAAKGLDIRLFWDRAEAIAHLREAAPRLNITRPPGI